MGKGPAMVVQIESDDVKRSGNNNDEHGSSDEARDGAEGEDQDKYEKLLVTGAREQLDGANDLNENAGPDNGSDERLKVVVGKRKQESDKESAHEIHGPSPVKRTSTSPDDRILQLESRVRQLEAQARRTATEQTTDAYPYSFWPELPWETLPNGYATLQTPLEWAVANIMPKRSDTSSDWQRRRAKNKISWMRSRVYKEREAT
jgi:hypothetical protein